MTATAGYRDQDLQRPVVMPVKVGVEVQVRSSQHNLTTQKAAPACWGISNGYWYCVTHQANFLHNWDKDDHCKQPGTHVIGWICKDHGIEVP